VANTIIPDLVDGECIISAALVDAEGFTIERTSNEFKPKSMTAIMDLNPNSSMITVVTEENTVIISRIDSGYSIVIQCPTGGNLGKARLKLSKACNAILPFL
tara:strand:- start:418 stop:723 length:306 start_codon:yes stop_codon:yes gene_type:complete